MTSALRAGTLSHLPRAWPDLHLGVHIALTESSSYLVS